MNEGMNGLDGRTDGRMEGGMDGWMDGCAYVCVYQQQEHTPVICGGHTAVTTRNCGTSLCTSIDHTGTGAGVSDQRACQQCLLTRFSFLRVSSYWENHCQYSSTSSLLLVLHLAHSYKRSAASVWFRRVLLPVFVGLGVVAAGCWTRSKQSNGTRLQSFYASMLSARPQPTAQTQSQGPWTPSVAEADL